MRWSPKMPAARPRAGEFQKSESVSFMSAINGGNQHVRRGVGLAESLAIVLFYFILFYFILFYFLKFTNYLKQLRFQIKPRHSL